MPIFFRLLCYGLSLPSLKGMLSLCLPNVWFYALNVMVLSHVLNIYRGPIILVIYIKDIGLLLCSSIFEFLFFMICKLISNIFHQEYIDLSIYLFIYLILTFMSIPIFNSRIFNNLFPTWKLARVECFTIFSFSNFQREGSCLLGEKWLFESIIVHKGDKVAIVTHTLIKI